MKKRIIAVFLCISMLGGISINVSAGSNSLQIPGIVNFFEKIGGTVISKLSSLITKDYTYEPAQKKEHSWVASSSEEMNFDTETEINAQTWKSVEFSFVSTRTYSNPFNDVDLDFILIGNGRKYTIPGFWNGGDEWTIRFACPYAGTWKVKTICSDETNTGLHGRTLKVNCSEYSGNLEIYKHGFVTTSYGYKYFTYDDGKPFLYLGDTHWSLGDETQEMVSEICEKRVSQGFTVIQSEPLNETFGFSAGPMDINVNALKEYDKKFKTIADSGLVHANAEFFFPYYMGPLIDNNGGFSDKLITGIVDGRNASAYELADATKQYLRRITRYWVARYSSYPVMWTLGQEVDNDFYCNVPGFNCLNNPYLLVAEYIDEFDAYDHPLSAHQENVNTTSSLGNAAGTDEKPSVYRKNISSSAFRNIKAHDWYAVQWSPSKTSQSDFSIEKEYWYNSQGKPSVNYEGSYCYLWTKNFGARMQGWNAYLNGFYGYGWGGHDTWSYTNVYDEDTDSSDGVDTITSQEKKDATWHDSLEYDSAYQSGYMIDFLDKIEWWNLIPRFDDRSYFSPCRNVFYTCAGNSDNSEIVIYFYSFSDSSVAEKSNAKSKYAGILTGTVGNLEPSQEYKYRWFNPLTGEFSDEQTFNSSSLGTWYIGERKWNGETVSTDMVITIYR